jgi:hypothetical protein
MTTCIGRPTRRFGLRPLAGTGAAHGAWGPSFTHYKPGRTPRLRLSPVSWTGFLDCTTRLTHAHPLVKTEAVTASYSLGFCVPLVRIQTGGAEKKMLDKGLIKRKDNDRNPRGSPQNRPMRVTSKPANGADSEQELLYPADGGSGNVFRCPAQSPGLFCQHLGGG